MPPPQRSAAPPYTHGRPAAPPPYPAEPRQPAGPPPYTPQWSAAPSGSAPGAGYAYPHDPFAVSSPYTSVPQPGPQPQARAPRGAGTRAAVALCVVLGLGLIGGAVAGAVINHGPRVARPPAAGSVEAFATVRQVWHSTPVDTLFPRTETAKGGGPGGADRTWTRIGVAAPSGCTGAFDPLLQRVLAPAGCLKLLRATYVDSTSTTVTTVGLLVGTAEAPVMRALNTRWTAERLGERADLIPRPVPFPGTPAASFGPRQRGSWDVQVAADLPFVVYAVSGFADGRTLTAQPADKATADGSTTVPAQAGLGYDATGLASAVDDRLHTAASALLDPDAGHPSTEK